MHHYLFFLGPTLCLISNVSHLSLSPPITALLSGFANPLLLSISSLPLPLILMATTSIQSLHQPFHHHRRHHHHHRLSTPDTTLTLRQPHPHRPISTASSVLTPTTSSSTFEALSHHLASANFREADEETRRLLITLAGEAAEKRGYVFFSEVQFISPADLQAIDSLWLRHSNNRFGYSVQRRLWDKSLRDFSRLFIRLGWMKKLDTEVEQHNYRAFPDEFIWELRDDTPEGHLPLTNALRGAQLMENILTHPAFDGEEGEGGGGGGGESGREEGNPSGVGGGDRKGFKNDYSF